MNRTLWFSVLVVLLVFVFEKANAINDSLVFKNGNILVGEIKSMDKGVLIFKTDYSDKDFKQ